MATSEGGNSVETISSEEISHSYAFFHRLCMTDKLSEKEARLFFEKSLLPDKEFDQLWKLSDLNKNGFLTVGDFIIFVHFVKERLLGVSLPEEVPSSCKDKVQSLKLPSCSDEHIAKCKMVFREYKQFVDSDGKMDVEGAKFLLSRSKLTSSQLFHIWKLSDVDCDGKLLFTEFVVAIHLVNLVLKGYSLPVSLRHKYILKSKKIKPPDLTVPVSKVKSAHIPWIQSGSAPLPTTTTDRSSSHFVLPSTPLSPGPGLPTPEHPFMSFSTFARYGPPSPLLKRQHGAPTSTPSAQGVPNGGLKPKPQYVNLLVSENGPVPPGSEASLSLPPPPLPPRLQTTPQPMLIPSPTPSPSHVSPVPVRMVPISISSTPSPPPPAQLSTVDPNLEFMKSLEDLTSIGSFDLLHSLSPPLSPLVTTDTRKKSTEQQLMVADLDDLVAVLSEMESTVLSLDNSPKVGTKVQPEKKKAVKVERRKSEPVDTSQLLDDSDIGKLEDAIEGAIRDASPVQEVDLLAKNLFKQHQQPQQKESEEYVDLIASLQSVAVVGESQKGSEKTGHTEPLKPIADKAADRGQRTKPPVAKNKPNIKALRNGTKVGKVESEDPLGLDSYLKEELDSMNQVLEQFN